MSPYRITRSLLTRQQARSYYDKSGRWEDNLSFYGRPAIKRLLEHGDFGTASEVVEFGCGATFARWASRGCELVHVICTDGSKGTWDPNADLVPVDVVGPVCESGDFVARERPLPDLSQGDLLVIRGAGAYGREMQSMYNARPLPPEVLVDGSRSRVVRRRSGPEALWQGEILA